MKLFIVYAILESYLKHPAHEDDLIDIEILVVVTAFGIVL